MKKHAWLVGFVSLGALLGAVGCGGGDGGGGSYSSGVSPSKQGEDVTQDEAKQFCESFYDYSQAHAPSQASICKATGLVSAVFAAIDTSQTDAQLQQICASAESDCNSQAAEPSTPPDCSDAQVPTSCTSTIGEIETCVTDSANQTSSQYSSLPSCSSVTRAMIQERDNDSDSGSDLPASCQTVQENCPEVLLRLGIN